MAAAPINLPELLRDLRGRLLINNGKYPISEKQEAVLRRIEAKVYAVG
jgi:hypothetical protein